MLELEDDNQVFSHWPRPFLAQLRLQPISELLTFILEIPRHRGMGSINEVYYDVTNSYHCDFTWGIFEKTLYNHHL